MFKCLPYDIENVCTFMYNVMCASNIKVGSENNILTQHANPRETSGMEQICAQILCMCAH